MTFDPTGGGVSRAEPCRPGRPVSAAARDRRSASRAPDEGAGRKAAGRPA